jgi:hypothetical protein
MMLVCLATAAWAVGPSHSAKAKPGWAVPLDCGYQPTFDGIADDDALYDGLWRGGDIDYSPLPAIVQDNQRTVAAPKTVTKSPVTPPAWFGCGGMPDYPCGNFLAERHMPSGVPYTYGPYWPQAKTIRPAVARPANPVWFSAVTGYDAAYDAAITGVPAKPSGKVAATSKAPRRPHWDEHDDYIACPLALEDSDDASSYDRPTMASLESGAGRFKVREYNYMSAHDPQFGNDCGAEEPVTFDYYEELCIAEIAKLGERVPADDYRPWNCDTGISRSLTSDDWASADASAFTTVAKASRQASQWIVIAAAATLEQFAEVLDEISLSLENAAHRARSTASSGVSDACWE